MMGDKTNTADCGEHIILCLRCSHDRLDGIKFHSCGTNKSSGKTMGCCIPLLDYLASNSEAKMRNHALDMIINIHSNASYLSKIKARIRACGHFFHGMDTQEQGTHQIKWRIL
jgi:hypothetical protein